MEEETGAPLTERQNFIQTSPNISSVKQISAFEDRVETTLLKQVTDSHHMHGDRSSSYSSITNVHLREKKLSTGAKNSVVGTVTPFKETQKAVNIINNRDKQ